MADKSLEETVMANLAAKRNNRRPYRENRVSSNRSYGAVGKARYQPQSRHDDDTARPAKLLISNLDFNVSEDDIRELYSPFGETRRLVMNYDRSGRSLGTAEIVYKNRADAMKAMQKYNGVPLDGKAMRLEVVNSGGVGSVSGGGRMNIPRMNNSRPIPYGGRYQRNSNSQQQRKPRTNNNSNRIEAKADDLDAEMDAYMAAGKKSEKKTNDDDDDLLNDDSKEEEKTGNGDNAAQPLADGDDDINLDEEI